MAILHAGSLLTKLLSGKGFEDIAKHHLKAWFHVAVAPLLPRLFSGRFSAGLGDPGCRCPEPRCPVADGLGAWWRSGGCGSSSGGGVTSSGGGGLCRTPAVSSQPAVTSNLPTG